jgi:hypothetical protein
MYKNRQARTIDVNAMYCQKTFCIGIWSSYSVVEYFSIFGCKNSSINKYLTGVLEELSYFTYRL